MIMCFVSIRREKHCAETVLFGGNRSVQVLLHQWKMILYTVFVYTESFKMCIWINEILFVCVQTVLFHSPVCFHFK